MRCGATRGTKASRCTVLSTTGRPSHQRGLQASGAGGFQQAYPNIRGELGLGHRALSCDNRLSRVGAGSGIDRLSCFACVLCICPPVPYLERGIPQSVETNARSRLLRRSAHSRLLNTCRSGTMKALRKPELSTRVHTERPSALILAICTAAAAVSDRLGTLHQHRPALR